MRFRTKAAFVLLIFLICIAVLDRTVPARHLPWKPLDPDAKIGLATGTQITLIALRPSKVCLGKLADAKHLGYFQADPKVGSPHKKCGWKVATTMNDVAGISFRPAAVTAQCPHMLASYIWLKDVDKNARKILGSPLKRVHHAGTYSCRRQRGNSSGAWSEHAFANAWDITGFELEDGRVISVLKNWDSKTNKATKAQKAEKKARAKFLHKSRDSACNLFRVVLSPDYTPAHRDHLHLDQGPSSTCR